MIYKIEKVDGVLTDFLKEHYEGGDFSYSIHQEIISDFARDYSERLFGIVDDDETLRSIAVKMYEEDKGHIYDPQKKGWLVCYEWQKEFNDRIKKLQEPNTFESFIEFEKREHCYFIIDLKGMNFVFVNDVTEEINNEEIQELLNNSSIVDITDDFLKEISFKEIANYIEKAGIDNIKEIEKKYNAFGILEL